MYCHKCGKQIPLQSRTCPHCRSTIAIQQAVPLPMKATRKKQAMLFLSALGLVCFAVFVFSASRDTGQIQPVPPAAPLESSSPAAITTPKPERLSKSPNKISVSVRSAPGSGTTQFDSAASPAPAVRGEIGAPVRSLAPNRERVEETFYITRTGARYHRDSCRHLRYSSYPITRSRAEAQGYTPCRVCSP